MTNDREPASQWVTKKELIYCTLGFLAFGFLFLFVTIFRDIGPISVIVTAIAFFAAGVGSAPLFYKFWFKRND